MTVTNVSSDCCSFDSCGEFADYMLETAIDVAAAATRLFCKVAEMILTFPIILPVAVYMLCAGERVDWSYFGCLDLQLVEHYAATFFTFITMPIAMWNKMRPVSIPGVRQETITVDPKAEEIGLPEGGTFVLNESKCFSFDSMINALRSPHCLSVQSRLSLWDDGDFLNRELKTNILGTSRFQNVPISSRAKSGHAKVCLYTHVLFDLLCKYKNIAEEEGTVEAYREAFNVIMGEVYQTFANGCDRNRIGALSYIIADMINLHPRLSAPLGIDSLVQARFAVKLFQYQQQEARQLASKSGVDVADLELALLKTLGIVKANYYDYSQRCFKFTEALADAADEFKQKYLPLQFFIENLKKPVDAGSPTANIQSDMLKWYGDQGVDLEDEEAALGTYKITKNRVIYFLWKNDLLRQVQ